MPIINTLFLLFLVPFAISQSVESDVFDMIENTKEGKEIMDNFLLDMNLEEENFNSNSIGKRLKILINGAKNSRKVNREEGEKNEKYCKKSIHSLKSSFQDFAFRLIALAKTLDYKRC